MDEASCRGGVCCAGVGRIEENILEENGGFFLSANRRKDLSCGNKINIIG